MTNPPNDVANLNETIARLSQLPPSSNPVLSCFVNTAAIGGPPSHVTFLKKAFSDRIRTFPERSAERASLEADRDRLMEYFADELDPAARSVAIYASHADDLWEAHPFRAMFDDHQLVVAPIPHLYPLVRLADQAPLYAVCVADAKLARVVVCGLGDVLSEQDIEPSEPIQRTRVSGWAELRYQSRIEDHLHKNAKEIGDRLAAIVSASEVDHVILAGDEPFLSELRHVLPPPVQELLVDVEHIRVDANQREILRRTIDVVRQKEVEDSRRLADTAIDLYRAGGLGVAGLDPTIEALNADQVDVLLLHEAFDGEVGWTCPQCRVLGRAPVPAECPFCAASPVDELDLREAMIRRAERVGRRVEIVEEHETLAALGGVGATLRYRV